jgi:hypothetical protein
LIDRDVAKILHLIAERFEAPIEIGNPYRGRPHVNSAAAGSQIERGAYHGDVGLLHGLKVHAETQRKPFASSASLRAMLFHY